MTIGAGHSYSIYSCGREDAASGTEGSLSLYDGETKVAEIYWDCPWGSKHNKFSATVTDSVNYHIDTSGFNEYGGAIGNVIVSIEKLHSEQEEPTFMYKVLCAFRCGDYQVVC